ncbi:OB-fold putative lipoprotein [Serratia silvae]|uniref:tRNA_anti-like n=2 Tax=Serratia silvae TaxID=2824122 RepID=A0ABT0KFD2_9GAMM|nr:OB-fold putative lipoprotein [Serratia silvae]MCL1030723.1 hypothetical protein [Serratia silvae]
MKKLLKWMLYIFIALIIIGHFSGKGEDQSSAPVTSAPVSSAAVPSEAKTSSQKRSAKPEKEIFQTTANKLFNAYEENEVAIDEQMKGKLIAVTGIVQSIDKDFTGSVVIHLKTNNQFMPALMGMKNSQKGAAINLKKGQKVTIICERMSRIIGSPSGRSCVFQ